MYIVKSGNMEELVVKLKSVLRDNSSRLCYLTEQLSFDTLTNKLFMKGREKVLSTLEGKGNCQFDYFIMDDCIIKLGKGGEVKIIRE